MSATEEPRRACEFCKHESLAYHHSKDKEGCDIETRVAVPMPYDDCGVDDATPMLSWPEPGVLDWADHKPRLCISAYDSDGMDECIAIPVNFCPMCGRKLPASTEASE